MMIITITGHPGSGKTTVGKQIASKLGYDFVSIGDLRGELAKEKGITINELNKIGETEDWTDKQVDEKQKELAKKDNIVFDSRLGFHLIPDSVKIFLDIDEKIAAQRMMKTERTDELIGKTIEEQVKLIRERTESDNKRYQKYYGVKFNKKEKFDLWLDTSNLSKKEVVEKIMGFLEKFDQKD